MVSAAQRPRSERSPGAALAESALTGWDLASSLRLVSSSVKRIHVLCNGHWVKSLMFSQLSDFMTKEGSKIFFSTDLKQNFNQ